jgi:hypothetical protein
MSIFSSRRLGGAFFEFLLGASDDEVVVLHELGAVRVNAYGTVKWSVDTDVVEDWRTDADGNLLLKLMDSSELVLSLASGKAEAH